MRWFRRYLRITPNRVHSENSANIHQNTDETRDKEFVISSRLDDEIERKAFNIENLQSTNNLPRSIYCPITRMPMMDPVIISDGNSYERKAIIEWVKKKKTSPLTGNKILENVILPNHSLRATISEIIIN